MAGEEDAGDNELVAPAPAPKKRRWPLLAAVAVVLLGAGGGGWYWFSHHAAGAATAEARKPAVVLSKDEIYLPLMPAFVVNFDDDGAPRYLQVAMTLMAHDNAAIDTAKAADPVLRDALVELLSNQDAKTVNTAEGRKKLQAQALAAVQGVVKKRLGRPGIEALYFTSFVVQ